MEFFLGLLGQAKITENVVIYSNGHAYCQPKDHTEQALGIGGETQAQEHGFTTYLLGLKRITQTTEGSFATAK